MYKPIYKILSLSDFWGNALCECRLVFHLTSTALLHYLEKFKNLKGQLSVYSYDHNNTRFFIERFASWSLYETQCH